MKLGLTAATLGVIALGTLPSQVENPRSLALEVQEATAATNSEIMAVIDLNDIMELSPTERLFMLFPFNSEGIQARNDLIQEEAQEIYNWRREMYTTEPPIDSNEYPQWLEKKQKGLSEMIEGHALKREELMKNPLFLK